MQNRATRAIWGHSFEPGGLGVRRKMVQRVATVAFEGIEVRPVDVQVQVAPGMPAFPIVGLPDKARGARAGALGVDRFGAGFAGPPHHHQSRARRFAQGGQPLRFADRARSDGGDWRHSA